MRNGFLILALLTNWLTASVGYATEFDFLVIGVIDSSKQQQGVALMKEKKSGKVAVYREGEQIKSDLTLTKVKRKYVLMNWQGKSYQLSVGDGVPQEVHESPAASSVPVADLRRADGIERDGNTLHVSDSLKNALISENLSQVLMQAAAVPHTENGQLKGFRLLEIDQGSIFDMAGLKNGDVITHINETPINSASAAIKTLNGLRNAEQVSFQYLRANESHELMVRIN
jgi:general secretion pathway protein C